jgi:site-specific recombinase XerD
MLIHVRLGKGNKDRYVLLGETVLALLRDYYKTARRKGVYLFPGCKPQSPLCPAAVRKVMKKALHKAGLPKKITFHTLRHYAEFRIMPSVGLFGLSIRGLAISHSA